MVEGDGGLGVVRTWVPGTIDSRLRGNDGLGAQGCLIFEDLRTNERGPGI